MSGSGVDRKVRAHILLESSQEFAELVWQIKRQDMSLSAPNLDTSSIFAKHAGSIHAGFIELAPMLASFYYGSFDGDAWARFRQFASDAAGVYSAADGTAVMVHAGTHSTLCPTHDMSLIHPALPPMLSGMREDRNLTGMIYAMLQQENGLAIEWLANAFPALKPSQPGSRQDVALAERARERILNNKRQPAFIDPRTILPKPAIPCIYVKPRGARDFDLFNGGEYRKGLQNGQAYTSTDKLLEDFMKHRDREFGPDAESVLVKVAPSELDQANPLDPPAIRQRNLKAAAEAGIDRVLLDRRVGVVDSTDTPDWPEGLRRPPIFAV